MGRETKPNTFPRRLDFNQYVSLPLLVQALGH